MEYQVPQFIEVENKIVGPLTLRQFIYIAGAVGFCVLFFAYLPILVALLLSAPVVALAAALSFYKVNGKPFIEVIEAGLHYYTGAKLLLWKHENPKEEEQGAAAAAAAADEALHAARTPRLTRGKLSELAWSLDVSTNTTNASGGPSITPKQTP
jgi:hypothetical protein